jgi:serine protease Do
MSNTVIKLIVLFAPLVLVACKQDPGQAALRRTVALRYQAENKAMGAGLLMHSGVVLTCAHVPLPRAPRMPVLLAGDRTMEVVFSDPAFDLALLAEPGQPWKVDDSEDWVAREQVSPGDAIALSGAPFGLADSLLLGSVNHTNRAGLDPAFPEIPFLQVQGVSYPGTSGAPVFHRKGLIGIHRASYGSASTGLGLVIPSGYVREFLRRATEHSLRLHNE